MSALAVSSIVPVGARLSWTVRESFWRYVIDAGGSIMAVGAAEIVGDEARFARAADGPGGAVAFSGGVLFDAHHGALRAAVFDPVLESTSGGVTMTARLDHRRDERVRLADLDPHTLSATLRAEASALFDFRYPAGSALAPVRFV